MLHLGLDIDILEARNHPYYLQEVKVFELQSADLPELLFGHNCSWIEPGLRVDLLSENVLCGNADGRTGRTRDFQYPDFLAQMCTSSLLMLYNFSRKEKYFSYV